MSKNLLLEACREYIELFQDSDMSPEDECHELYTKMTEAVAAADGMVMLLGKPDKMSFHVPEEFLSMLRQVAENRGVKPKIVFKELVELMTEELHRELA